jgi:peptidyl-prolyl cis-trans isomerase-like 1
MQKQPSYAAAPLSQSPDLQNVVLETPLGNIYIELYWHHAPNTCKNFAELAKKGYYNGTIFHRVIQVK